MNANELQIGDKLNLSDEPGEVIPCEVVELHTDELLVIQPGDKACDIVGYNMIYPIPLTAEILEKNGLLTEQLYGVNHRVYCAEMSIERGMFLFEHRFGGQLDLQMAFEYVHELQHALRLCGLNELADNLKI